MKQKPLNRRHKPTRKTDWSAPEKRKGEGGTTGEGTGDTHHKLETGRKTQQPQPPGEACSGFYIWGFATQASTGSIPHQLYLPQVAKG